MNLNGVERAEIAVELKTKHKYNCCQAVTAVLADQTELTEEQLFAIAAPFCVGMGTMEATCGCLIGAGMIAGLKTEGQKTLPLGKKILEKFKESSGGVITCRELKQLVDGKPVCSCEDCVRHAVAAYEEVMGIVQMLS